MDKTDSSRTAVPGTNSHPPNKADSSEASTEAEIDSASPSIKSKEKPDKQVSRAETPHSGDESDATSPVVEVAMPISYLKGYEVIVDQHGVVHVITGGRWNRQTHKVGSKQLTKIIRRNAREMGTTLKGGEIREIFEALLEFGETDGRRSDVFYRVAPIENGIEIDLGDESHSRVRILPGKVEIVREGSEALFHRPEEMLPIKVDSEKGDYKLFYKYLPNVAVTDRVLLVVWIASTMANPKLSFVAFLILVLLGGQGTGKTTTTKLISRIIDPRIVGVQVMPRNMKDLVIAAQRAHLLSYDNLRGFRGSTSDILCVMVTGGAVVLRKLYTDDEPHIVYVHVALILNSLHEIITESDLAQRSLPIRLNPLSESDRVSESKLEHDLETDLPIIIRGFHELIAEIFKYLPDVKVTNPERMIDFSRWLAAMEMVDGAPPGIYQSLYSECLVEAQLESLLANPLAAALLDFVQGRSKTWEGKPTELLAELNGFTPFAMQRTPDWPKNSIALGRRISSLQAGLKTQGIEITQTRGKHRKIVVTTTEIRNEEY
jgi:energy-coupling factor transporter ATP-binding protein EcfA2